MATSRSRRRTSRSTMRKRANNLANTMSAILGTNQSSGNTMEGQISNYKSRLQNIGVDPEKAIDKRNPIEKALNLKQDQNVLFDIFELLNRPQQALFGAVDNAINNKDVGKGALEGLTGKKETSGGKILRDLGMEGTGKGNIFTKEGRKNLALSDVLGLGLDIFADPLDYIAAPVKVTSEAGKAVKAADNVSDVLSKGSKLVKSADTVGDTARGIAKASAALNTVGDVGETSKVVWKPASSAILSYAGQGIKGGAKLTDKAIEKLLGVSDARNLKKAEKIIAKKGGKLDDVVKELGVSTSKLDIYKGLKKQLGKTVNSSENIGGLVGKAREARNTAEFNKNIGEKLAKNLEEDTMNIANKTAKNSDEAKKIFKNIQDALQTNIEHKYAPLDISGTDVLEKLKKGKNIDFFNEGSAKAITDELKNYGIKASNDGRYVTLLDDNRKLKALSDEFAKKNFGKYLSKEDMEDYAKATKLLNSSPELQELTQKYAQSNKNIFTDYSKMSDEMTGLNTTNIAKEGYVRHGLSDEARELKQAQGSYANSGASKAFKGRTFPGTAKEYNRLKEAGLLDKTDELVDSAAINGKLTKRGENAAKAIYKTDDVGNFVLDDSGKLIRDDNLQKTLVKQKQEKISRLNSELESSKELLKGQEDLSKIDETKLTKKGLKNVNTLKAEKDFQETVSELKKLKFDTSEAPIKFKKEVIDLNQIPEESSEVIDNLRTSFTDYRKAKDAYVNGLKKKKITGFELESLKNQMNKSKKMVTANIDVAKKFQDKKGIEAIKNANKAFAEGKTTGRAIEKEMARLKTSQKQAATIYEAAHDLAESLPGQIKYEEAALKKLENSADAIFESKSKIMQQQAKAANILTSQEGIEYMNTSLLENFTDYINRNPQLTQAAQTYNEALATGLFNNNKYVKVLDNINDDVPTGFIKVNGTELANNLSYYNDILPKNSQDLTRVMDTFRGQTVAVDKDAAKLLNLGKNMKDKASPLVKVIDGINNTFKKFSTITPGFQMRNIVGNSTNMVLSGMPARELPGYYTKAVNLWNNADNLTKKFMDGTLTAAEKQDFNILQEFYKAGFADAFTKGEGLEDIVKGGKGIVGKASKASVKANEAVDTWNRLTLLMYAKDHPNYVKNLGRKNAVDAVRMVLFDPDNMSDLERTKFKKIIPFYTFTKQNLMFQAQNVMKNAPKYNRLYRSLKKSYDAIGDDQYYSYQRNNMQIPLPFTDKEGNQLFLKANLPVSDLGEFMSTPVQRTLASTSPILKVPVETVTGKSLFTGEDANYNTLKKAANKLGINSEGMNNTAQLAETILNGFGLQNVSTNLVKKVQAVIDRNDDNISDQQLWAEIFRSVLQNTKKENVMNSGLYDELEKYQAIIKRLKNQGIDVPTMTEINAANKIKVRNLKRKRARYSR